MRLLHGQSAPVVVAVESRPQPREGTLASVRCLPWTWLSHAVPCLSPWQPNSAMPTLYHIHRRLHPLLKGTQLGLLWGGGASFACPASPPLPGVGAKVRPPPHQEHSRHLSLASSGNDLDRQRPRCSSCPLSGLLLPVQWALVGMGCADDPKWQPIIK